MASCLDDLEAGATPAQCLARFPEYAAQLEPLLATAARLGVQSWPGLSPAARVRGRERMHAAVGRAEARRLIWRPLWRQLAVAVLLVILAAGAWLAWPGRQGTLGGRPTASPLSTGVAPVSSPTPTATATSAVSATLTATASPAAPAGPKGETVPPTASPVSTMRATATPAAAASRTPAPLGKPEATQGPEATDTAQQTAAPRATTAPPTHSHAGSIRYAGACADGGPHAHA